MKNGCVLYMAKGGTPMALPTVSKSQKKRAKTSHLAQWKEKNGIFLGIPKSWHGIC